MHGTSKPCAFTRTPWLVLRRSCAVLWFRWKCYAGEGWWWCSSNGFHRLVTHYYHVCQLLDVIYQIMFIFIPRFVLDCIALGDVGFFVILACRCSIGFAGFISSNHSHLIPWFLKAPSIHSGLNFFSSIKWGKLFIYSALCQQAQTLHAKTFATSMALDHAPMAAESKNFTFHPFRYKLLKGPKNFLSHCFAELQWTTSDQWDIARGRSWSKLTRSHQVIASVTLWPFGSWGQSLHCLRCLQKVKDHSHSLDPPTTSHNSNQTVSPQRHGLTYPDMLVHCSFAFFLGPSTELAWVPVVATEKRRSQLGALCFVGFLFAIRV